MNKLDAAKIISGLTDFETEQSPAPTNVHIITGEVGSTSEDGKVMVSLDGLVFSDDNDQFVEFDTLGGLEEGDTATILLTGENGRAMVPLAIGGVGTVDRIVERVGELYADYAEIGDLVAEKASITDLEAATARIGDLEADHVSVSDFQAEQANIDTLQANTADIATIRANSAKVQNLTAAQLEADHATIGTLDTTYMHANMSNSDVAWIENGTIKNGAIVSAMINDVSANKLTAGTINGSVINVTNLNADNITTGTINGQRIGEGSLSLSKLEDDVYTEAEVNNIVDGLNDRIDGAIETHTGTAVPTLNNSPASSWNTTKLKDEHVGDVYYVVNSQSQQNGYCYRFTKSGSAYSWQLIKDSDVTAALSRLTTAEGKITTFDSDISTLKTDTGTLTTRTTNLETRMSDAEDDILDKVDTTTFNEVSDTVDAHTQTISQHTTAIANKADSSTVTAVTNRVTKNEQDISGINTTIGQLQTTVESKADGSTVTTISNRLNTVSDTVDGHTQSITSLQNTVSQKADSSTVSTLQSDYATFKQQTEQFESTVGTTYATKTELNDATDDITELESRVSTNETSISNNSSAIALKANSSDVYTRTAVDGKITQEVTDRNSAITAKANEINLSVTEKVYQSAQPNLAPLGTVDFSDVYSATTNPDGYWKATLTSWFTRLDDGWVRVYRDNTSGTAAVNTIAWRPSPSPSVVAGSVYTILTEIRNNHSTGSSQTDMYLQQIANNQFWGDINGATIDDEHVTTTTNISLRTCGETYEQYSYRIADTEHLTTTPIEMFRYNFRLPAGGKFDFEFRQSVYDGIYDGPYKPYSGTQLYASQAELKVTNDSISTKVSKDGVISSINQSAESVTINASKINLVGAVTIGDLASDAQDVIYQSAQPNLSPFFSMPLSDADAYWYTLSVAYFTKLDDGWAHFERTNSGSSAANTYIRVRAISTLKAGGRYTLLVEFRNVSVTGNTNGSMYSQQANVTQVWGTDTYGGFSIANADIAALADGQGAFHKAITLLDDESKDPSGVVRGTLPKTGFIFINQSVAAGQTLSYDVRMSLYEGEYSGPYKPYSGTLLYATQTDAADAAKTATNYIVADSSGIKIADANPASSTTYQHQTSSGTDFVVDGGVRNRVDSTGMTLYNGSGTADENIVAKFTEALIEIGKNSTSAVIKFCGGVASLTYTTANKFFNITALRAALRGVSEYGNSETANAQVAAQFDVSSDGDTNTAILLQTATSSTASSNMQATAYGSPSASVELGSGNGTSTITMLADYGLKLNNGPNYIKGFNFGYSTGTTNSNGITTFNPGMGVKPTAVFVAAGKASNETEAVAKIAVPMVWSIDGATQVQVRWQRSDTNAWLASNAVGWYWLAIY